MSTIGIHSGFDLDCMTKIDAERQYGFDIYSVVLEHCSFDEKDQRERHWVGGLPNLVNDRLARCWSWLSQAEREHVEEIRLSHRDSIPNWCGHIGILHDRRLDAWQVQIQHWHSFYVLPGD